jgi:ribosomal protein L37AE/L43A
MNSMVIAVRSVATVKNNGTLKGRKKKMKLGGEATCPHCGHKEERDAEIHEIFTCGKCGKKYHFYVKIQVTTLPLMEG